MIPYSIKCSCKIHAIVFDGAFYAYKPICAVDIIEKGGKPFDLMF